MRRILLPLTALLFSVAAAGRPALSDEEVCSRIFTYARAQGLSARPIAEVVTRVAEQFLGFPYEAKTLDRGDDERVITNLRTFDCVTLVENTLALARCIKRGTLTFTAYRTELETIRYRGGTCRGYGSRLHYFSDWIADGEAKGIVKNITQDLGGRRIRKTINFMSTHRELYPRMRGDSAIAAAEARLSRAPSHLLPAAGAASVPPGAIVAIAASLPGLDVTHTGIAVSGGDRAVHLLHAPDTGDSVKITSEPLFRYAARSAGIIVVLPLEPR